MPPYQTKYDPRPRSAPYQAKLDVDVQQRIVERLALNLDGAVARAVKCGVPFELIVGAVTKVISK